MFLKNFNSTHLFLIIALWGLIGAFNKLDALCIKTSTANLRAGPSTKHAITWEVRRYTPLQLIKKRRSWYYVRDIDNDTHWVFSKLTSRNYFCVMIRVKKANLRTGPGNHYSKSPILPSVGKYQVFRLLKRKGNWVHIKDEDNDTYWIHKNLIWVQ